MKYTKIHDSRPDPQIDKTRYFRYHCWPLEGGNMRGLVFNSCTWIGVKREVNEDRLVLVPEQRLFAVIDGMGGSDDGEYAAELLQRELELLKNPNPKRVREAFFKTHTTLVQEARKDGISAGCVATVALFEPHEDKMLMAVIHVGDTRAYRLVNNKNDFCQITVDHEGRQRNSVTRLIGGSYDLRFSEIGAYYETYRTVLREGDRVLLTTDGLTKFVDRQVIHRALATLPLAEVVPRLKDEALEGQYRIKRSDNASFIAMQVL